MTHNCQTTLAPGVAWPAFSVITQPVPVRARRATPINARGQADIKAIVGAITQHGPCSTGRLMKHTGLSRQRTQTGIARVTNTKPPSIGLVRTEVLDNSCRSKIYGFLS